MRKGEAGRKTEIDRQTEIRRKKRNERGRIICNSIKE